MGLLEETLRDTLAAQVAVAPAVDDAAGRAIGRARRTRRLRSTFALAAVTVSLVLLGAGIAAVRAAPGNSGVAHLPTDPDADIWSAALPADVLVGNQIALAAGPVISLSALPPARQAWQVYGGWLVVTQDPVTAMSAVWFVGYSGVKTKLAQGEQVAVGRSGRGDHTGPMVAWGGAGWVSVATFSDGGLGVSTSTGGTGDLRPRGIVAGAVLLSDTPVGGQETYRMWFPDHGGFVAGPTFTDRVLGVTGTGDALLALVGQRGTCLAVIAPSDFAVLRSRCDLDLGAGDLASASPDGRWLVTLSRNGVDLYDFETVWHSPAPVANWPVYPTAVAWLSDGSFVVIDQRAVIRLRSTAPTRQEVAQVAPTGGQTVTAIADLRD